MTITPGKAKWLVGKTISAVELNPFLKGEPRPGETYDPIIRFSDGSSIGFMVEETEVGEYGVRIIYQPSK